jgi:hypothetical protein
MKRRVLPFVSLLFAAALPCTALSAQQIVPFVGGGVAIGMGDVGEDTDPGLLVVGGFDVPLPVVADGFGFGVTGAFANIPYKGTFSEKLQVTSVTAEISYLIGAATSSLRPYLRGGAGVQVNRYDPGDLDTQSSTNARLGFSGGAGLSFALGAANAIVGGRIAMSDEGGFVGGHVGVSIPVGP